MIKDFFVGFFGSLILLVVVAIIIAPIFALAFILPDRPEIGIPISILYFAVISGIINAFIGDYV